MSRRLRNIVAVIIMLTAATLCFLDHSCISRPVTKYLQSTQQQDSGDISKYHGRQFAVVKVVDGDTLDIDIPDDIISPTATTPTPESAFGASIRLKPKTRGQARCISAKRHRTSQLNSPSENR